MSTSTYLLGKSLLSKPIATLTMVLSMVGLLVTSAVEASANSKYAAFVYDANSGKVLFARNADSPRYPASLTKIMTLYLVFDALDQGKITLNTRMKVSRRAASMAPSKLYLKVGSTIKVKDAILALVTKSANDVAVVIAEHLAGSEANFARKMTHKARKIGMKNTTFKNASGLPNAKQRTTARDMARLGLSIRKKHPNSFQYFKTRSFKYAGQTYSNHNRLLGKVPGVNGIKTGYIRASGFNLVTNVESNGRHLVAVVMGGKSGASRNRHMTALINRFQSKASRKNSNVKQTPLLVAETAPPPLPLANPRASLVVATVATANPVPKPENLNKQAPIVIAANIDKNLKADDKSQEDQLIHPKVVTVSTIHIDETGRTVLQPSKNLSTASVAQTTKTAPREGWKIQISASPSLNEANKLLAEATEKGAAVLADAHPYTEPVKSGSATLYRVRFAGFDDKSEARQACVFMKKKRYKCIAVN